MWWQAYVIYDSCANFKGFQGFGLATASGLVEVESGVNSSGTVAVGWHGASLAGADTTAMVSPGLSAAGLIVSFPNRVLTCEYTKS